MTVPKVQKENRAGSADAYIRHELMRVPNSSCGSFTPEGRTLQAGIGSSRNERRPASEPFPHNHTAGQSSRG